MFAQPSVIILALLMSPIWAYLGYRIARARQRSTRLWAALCFGFGLYALIILYLLPKKEEKAKSITPQERPEGAMGQHWYYFTKEGSQIGPKSFPDVEEAYLEGFIDSNSYVWNDTYSDWQQLYKIKEIADYLSAISQSK